MIFTTPFIPFQSELIKMLTSADEMTFGVYDSALTVEEIMKDLQTLNTVQYGVIADISCTPTSAKTDSIRWRVGVRIELFSTYKGRKQIAEMINTIALVASKYRLVFDANMQGKGYAVVRENIEESTIGPAIIANGLTWQNGYINLSYELYQLGT